MKIKPIYAVVLLLVYLIFGDRKKTKVKMQTSVKSGIDLNDIISRPEIIVPPFKGGSHGVGIIQQDYELDPLESPVNPVVQPSDGKKFNKEIQNFK
jgi:hypothetical protein